MKSGMILVGMADLNITKAPGALTTLGLGSCVGIAIFDPISKIAGLAHIMLPDSRAISNNSNVAKFADTATAKMVFDMVKIGADRKRLKAKLAGGAQMFNFSATNDNMRIGDRNIEASRAVLRTLNIPIIAEDVGATYGRTVELYAEDGKYLIKTIGHGQRFI